MQINSMHRSLCILFFLLCVAPRSVDGFVATPFSGVGRVARKRLHDQQAVGINRTTTTTIMGVSRGESRSDALKSLSVAIAGTLAMTIAPSNAAAAARTTEELVQLVRDARGQLDPVDVLISGAKWDAIRTIIKTKPLADVKNVIAELARQADEDDSQLLLGMRQDVLDHVQYLDSFSYNNVFVGEERQILGTKIDFDTPRMELRQCREAFDLILEVLPSPE